MSRVFVDVPDGDECYNSWTGLVTCDWFDGSADWCKLYRRTVRIVEKSEGDRLELAAKKCWICQQGGPSECESLVTGN